MNRLITTLLILTTYYSCKPDQKLSFGNLQLDQLVNDGFHYNIIDSVFLISNQNYYDSDTFQCLIFDSLSRLVEIEIFEIMGGTIKYTYNKHGLIINTIASTDTYEEWYIRYSYDPSKRVLYQLWSKPGWRFNDYDTCFFYFNHQGKLIESVNIQGDKMSHSYTKYLTKYYYNSTGKISFKTEKLIKENFNVKDCDHNFFKNITLFYYTNNSIDSSITKSYCPLNIAKNYTYKTIFNKGRPFKTIKFDSIETTYLYRQSIP